LRLKKPPKGGFFYAQFSWKFAPSELGLIVGVLILMVKGIGKSLPIMTASPGCRLGRKSDAALSISPQARSTISRSRSLVNL
jgi:hypothetical protein